MITEKEAKLKEMSPFDIAWGILEGEIEPELYISPHGKVLEVKQEAYIDRIIYEDGFEEIISIGDWGNRNVETKNVFE